MTSRAEEDGKNWGSSVKGGFLAPCAARKRLKGEGGVLMGSKEIQCESVRSQSKVLKCDGFL
jgi:hypothetical protein